MKTLCLMQMGSCAVHPYMKSDILRTLFSVLVNDSWRPDMND
jgi:hypothetical protein